MQTMYSRQHVLPAGLAPRGAAEEANAQAGAAGPGQAPPDDERERLILEHAPLVRAIAEVSDEKAALQRGDR
jgi:hypothetical protein